MTDNKILDLLSFADDKFILEAFPEARRAPIFTMRRIYALAASVCVIATAVMAGILIPSSSNNLPSASLPEEKPLEYGFKFAPGSGYECPINGVVCAYKSDTNYFDIDNVIITFSFGYIIHDFETIEYLRETTVDIPNFDVFLFAEYYAGSGENLRTYGHSDRYLVRTSDVNLVSEEYRVTPIYGNNRLYVEEYIYNHSETLTIPQDIFQGEYGIIYLNVSGINIHASVQEIITIESSGGVHFGYDKIGSRIIISDISDWEARHHG